MNNNFLHTASSFVDKYSEIPEESTLDYFLMQINKVSGLRFQPIFSLKNEKLIAHEVLTSTSDDPDSFFSSISAELHLSLLLWQLDEIRPMPQVYWCNIPVIVLCEPYLITQFIAWGPARVNISIELQDPEKIQYLDPFHYHRLISGIRRLQQHGWNIILDDLTRTCAPHINSRDFKFSAVKFERSELRGNLDLAKQIYNARRLAPLIVLEGLETAEDLKFAHSSNADAGQGFLWPEIKLSCRVPEIVAHRALLWRQLFENIRKRRVTINITSRDTYFRMSITDLLCTVDTTEPNGMINLVDIPHDADLSIMVAERGPICLSCRRFVGGHNDKPPRFTLAFTDQDKSSLDKLPCITQAMPLRETVDDIFQSLSSSIHSLYSEKCESHVTQRSACSQCRIHTLTTREREVMYMTGAGCTPAIIATQIGCTDKVVSRFRRSAMRKLALTRSTEFIRMSCQLPY